MIVDLFFFIRVVGIRGGLHFFQCATELKYSSLSPLLPKIEDSALIRELNSHDWDVFLGHIRLSIIDPTLLGHQPMSDLSKNVWIVYNGEIYDLLQLRDKLRRLGYSFRSRSDKEVIIYAYIEWGISVVERFNVMFSFVIL